MKKTDHVYVHIRQIIFLLGVIILLVFCVFYLKGKFYGASMLVHPSVRPYKTVSSSR